MPDLAVTAADISLSPSGGQQRVTATVRNLSGIAVANVPVWFRDKTTGQIVGTQTITSISGWGSKDVSVLWTPSRQGARIEVEADPLDVILESTNLNNRAAAVYGDLNSSPVVVEASALYDADSDPGAFGRFISGVDLPNSFYASVVDPDGGTNVDHVDFTLGPLGTQTDIYGANGWSAEFDMGQLSGNTTLSIVAYDTQGHASAPWTGTVHVVPFPSWLGTPDGDDRFVGGAYDLNGFFPEQLEITHTIPSGWWIIGGKESEFRLGVELGLTASLDARQDVPIDHEFVFEAKILGEEIFDYGGDQFVFSPGSGVSMSLSGLADGDNLSLAGLSGSLTVDNWSPFDGGTYSVPEVSQTVYVYGIPVRVALGMNFAMELDAQLTLGLSASQGTVEVLSGTYIEPSVSGEPYVFLGLGWDAINTGLEVGGELGLHYRGHYDSTGGYSDYSWGTFQINLSAVAKAFLFKVRKTWTVPSGAPWSFGNVPAGASLMMAAMDGPAGPDLLAWPNVAANAVGNVLLTRVVDADAAAGQVDPEIAYALRDAGGTWTALNPVAGNDLIESDPIGAFDGQGGAVVSWVTNTIAPALVETTEWDVYLETQEIHSSYWDGASWSTPQAVTSDARMDGGPEIAFHNGQGLMLWEHAGGAGSMELDGFELKYAVWDDTTHAWSSPVALTNDTEGDWAPTVAFGPSGQAMAVWVHDADSNPTTAALHYATWNGSIWSVPAAVPISSTEGVREPQIAYASTGDVLLGWIGNEGGADILYTSIWNHTTSSWSTPETVPETPGMIEGLDLDVSASDDAMLVWHGWDGQNDLFSTSRNLGTSDPWAPPVRITDSVDGEWMASTTFDSAGTAVTVWANDAATTVFGEGAEGVDIETVPNLTAENIEVMAIGYVEGEEALLTVDVSNVGLAPSAATTVEFFLGDPNSGGTPIGGPVDVAALLPGESVFLVSESFFLPTGTNDYCAVVTADPAETIIDDNTGYTTLQSAPPDVSGPQVAADLPAGTSVLNLTFDEPILMLSESNISLVELAWGTRPPEHVYLSTDQTSAQLIFEGGLAAGNYTLKVLDSVVDLVGNPLDGNGDGSPGGDYVTTFVISAVSRVEHVLVRQFTVFDDQDAGEVSTLPSNEEWIDEWASFYVEVWVSTPNTDATGVVSAQVDLTYNADYFTATGIEYGPGFDLLQIGTIDDVAGVVDDLGAGTLASDVGDDQHALLARVRFEPTGDDPGVPLGADGKYITPASNGFGLDNAEVTLVGNISADVELGDPPGTELWPVMYDIDDSSLIDFGDFTFFATAFAQDVEDGSPWYVLASDFDRSGLVDFGDFTFFATNFAVGKTDGIERQYPGNFPGDWRPSPLTLEVPLAPPQGSAALVTDQKLNPIVSEAMHRLEVSEGSEAKVILENVTVEIVDLPGNRLGQSLGNHVWIDLDAAGYGWFIDATPGDDVEFSRRTGTDALMATLDSPARGRVDLLTTLMHEFGHVLGYEHASDNNAMHATLPLSTRRLLSEDLLFSSFASDEENADEFWDERDSTLAGMETLDAVFVEWEKSFV